MNFGQNMFTWLSAQAGYVVLVGIVIIGIFLIMKREFTKLLGFAVVAIIAVGFVFNTTGVKDVMLEMFNKILGI